LQEARGQHLGVRRVDVHVAGHEAARLLRGRAEQRLDGRARGYDDVARGGRLAVPGDDEELDAAPVAEAGLAERLDEEQRRGEAAIDLDVLVAGGGRVVPEVEDARGGLAALHQRLQEAPEVGRAGGADLEAPLAELRVRVTGRDLDDGPAEPGGQRGREALAVGEDEGRLVVS
jgi:hypothetical protein